MTVAGAVIETVSSAKDIVEDSVEPVATAATLSSAVAPAV